MKGSPYTRFKRPDPEYGPTPLWWWSGARITEERIRWQLERFIEGGIRNLVIMNLAPKGPAFGAPPDDPAWFSEEWWDLFTFACREAEKRGMRLWFYDQLGFSGANIQGEIIARDHRAAGQMLRSRLTTAGETGDVGLRPRQHLIGIFAQRPSDGTWSKVDGPGGQAVVAAGSEVRVVYWEEAGFNFLERAPCAALIDSVHGEFERRASEWLGSVIVGSFQDELPVMPTWSPTFSGEFSVRLGYDLLAHLPLLWEFENESAERIRADYHRIRTELAEEAFFRPLGEWHSQRGMLVGADQTNPARAGWPTQSSQLYGDYIQTHRWLSAVGSDHEGDARVHSSMADLYEHPRVWIESFHSSGWGGTLEETWDWLLPFFRSGADLYNPHATYFDTKAGWFEWAPPSTDFRQPYYAAYPEFAQAVARTASLLTWGVHDASVGVLYPSSTVHANLPPDASIDYFGDGQMGEGYEAADAAQSAYLRLSGTNNWFKSSPGLLDRSGIDFDVVDEDSVLRAEVTEGELRVGRVGVTVLLLPSVTHLPIELVQQLLRHMNQGGTVVVVGSAPRTLLGAAAEEESAALQRLHEHPSLRFAKSAEEALTRVPEASVHAWAPESMRVRRDGETAVGFLPAAFPNGTAYPLRSAPESLHWEDIDFDPARYAASTSVRVNADVDDAEVWYPTTGETRSARVSRGESGSIIEVDFKGAPCVFVAWQEATPNALPTAEISSLPGHSQGRESLSGRLISSSEWTHELMSTADNEWGDFHLPAGDACPFEVWRFGWSEGKGPGETVRATFGQYVATLGPTKEPPRSLDISEVAEVRNGAPLISSGWNCIRFSNSRGIDTDRAPKYEPKGAVPEEFLVMDAPIDGEIVVLRTILRVGSPGTYDLTVAAPASKRVWFDGVELAVEGEGHAVTLPVHFMESVGVLELHIGANEEPPNVHGDLPRSMGAWFTLHRQGRAPVRPEFVNPAEIENGEGVFRKGFFLSSEATEFTVTAGSTSALRIEVDGELVARQEKVQYYGSEAVNRPMYFTHHLGELEAGAHELTVVAETAHPEHGIWVDGLLKTADGLWPLVSGTDWETGGAGAPARMVRGLGGGQAHAHTARRPHPLVSAQWLSGPPELGESSELFEASTSLEKSPQSYLVTLPSGTRKAFLPVECAEVELSHGEMSVEGKELVLDRPRGEPTELLVRVSSRAFSRAGAAWEGPVHIESGPFQGGFKPWEEWGLGSWSGAVRSSCQIEIHRDCEVELDLGRVRGAVEMALDGELVTRLFCAPYRASLGEISEGQHTLEVTVYGTLAPRLEAISPTPHITPSQLRTGIFGPVELKEAKAHG